MKKKVVSLLLSAAMVMSNVMVTTAAEPGQVTQSVELSENELEVGLETEANVEEVLVNEENLTTEDGADSTIMSRAGEAVDSITADDRMGVFLMLNGGNISTVLHQNYDATVKIPKGLVLDTKNTSVKVQSNYYFGGKLPNMAERTFAISAPGAEKTISLDNYLTKVRGFKSADVNITIGDKATSYVVSANSDGTEFNATAGAGAKEAISEVYSYMEENSEAKGILLKKGGYIQIGNQKLEFDNNASDFSVGSGDINVNDLKQKIRETFVLKKTATNKNAQVTVMLPKGSSAGIRTRGAVLTTDTLITVNGLADTFNTIGLEDTILTKLYNASSGTNTELATALLDIVSNLAEAADGQKISVDVRFADKNVSVESVELSKDAAEVEVGSSMMLGCRVLPIEILNKGLIWTSSDPSVATVKDGMVTGVSVGTTIITATSIADSSKTDSCVVTVKKQSGQQEVIPGAEGKDLIDVAADVYETVDEEGKTIVQIPDEIVEQITSVIANATEDEVPVIVIPVAKEKAPELPAAILEAAQEAGVSAVVVKTEAMDADTVPVTITIPVTEDMDTSIPLKLGVSATLGEKEGEIVKDNIPSDAKVLKLDLEHEGAFPVGEVILTLDVKKAGFMAGELVYVYHVDSEQGTVKTLNDKGFTVSESYTVSIPLTHASAYVVTSKKAVIVPTSVTLDETSVVMTAGDKKTLKANVFPTDVANKEVKWSSDNKNIATVDEKTGEVTAVAEGRTKIWATAVANEKVRASCDVTVNEKVIDPESVSLNRTTLDMTEGDTFALIPTVLPENANNKKVTWSSDAPNVASVNAETGVVTAAAPGTAKITAKTFNGKTADCLVTVKKRIVEPTGVKLDVTEKVLTVDEEFTLKATVEPEAASDKTVTWDSDNKSVASVDANGKVKALKPGTATITVMTKNNKTATCKVTVNAKVVLPTSVALDETQMTVTAGEKFTLVATVKPDNANDKSVTWTSNKTSVVTVDANTGEATAVAAGKATITATTVNGLTATCEVTVNAAPVMPTGVTLNATEKVLTVGDIFTLIATVKPDNADSKAVTWTSSKPEVATVEDGKVTAVSPGQTDITAETVNGKTATCKVTVNAVVVEPSSVTLNETKLDLTTGQSFELKETVLPENANDKTVTWDSKDKSVAVVDQNGKVTAVAAGTTVITVKTNTGGHTAACEVTVTDPIVEPTSITLNQTNVTLIMGQSYTLIATVLPADADDKTVAWTSSDTKVATVDANGKITAITAGTTDITAKTANGKTAVCKVTVNAAVVQAGSVSLSASSLKMKTGDTSCLTATVLPADTTDKTITWKSSDAAVASVASDGTVTALKRGTATITATTVNGKTASCTVAITLAAPVVKVANTTTSSVKLTWTKVSGASKYVVYRSTKKSGKYKKVGATKSTSYTNKKLTANKKYYYKVLSYDSKAGAYSKVIAAKASLQKVTISSASAGKKTATLKWRKVSGASRYQVYMKAPGGKYKLVATTKKTSLKQKKLKSKKSYSFKVRAYRTVKGKRYYGSYSAVKRVKVK